MTEADDTRAAELEAVDASTEPEVDETKSTPADRETAGPFDSTEVPAMRPYVDLGGVKVAPREGQQLRLDVEESTKRIVAVSLDYLNSTLQVQAFSSPRSTGLWHHFRAQIAQQLRAQGATITEREGALGPELLAELPLPEERGGGTRPVRFIGVDGPRWTLRGVITGQANVDEDVARQVEELYRSLVVVRGEQPMPPMELLALRVPAGAERSV
ncbi:DUF3710 domain-containing protein [Leucobacter sp. M11]|uniref:DUF3710 domain-containing protein n=1 Tax=Leucobacter sp. M11 TaxID=2993565 RepID=UPI002D7E6D55|nr:DUF3710 domain-containing protein [Leucobacter sp. M11]MEB4616173.1 DUF3710 domain-containing protein [Leucobacter sp. M11]